MKKTLLALLALAVSAFSLDINTTAEEFIKVKGIGKKKLNTESSIVSMNSKMSKASVRKFCIIKEES